MTETLKERRLSLEQGMRSQCAHLKRSSLAGDKRLVAPKLLWKVERSGKGDGEVSTPCDLTFLPDRNMVVSEVANRRLQVFDNNGRSVRMMTAGGFTPAGVAVDKTMTSHGAIVAINTHSKSLSFFSPASGELISKWPADMFKEPRGVAVMNSGRYVITDIARDAALKIHICDQNGAVIRAFGGGNSWESDHLHTPSYVTVDQYERIIVSDWYNHCVKIFDPDGNSILDFGTSAGMKYPNGVFADYMDNIMVVENGNHRVMLYSSCGNLMQQLLTAEDGVCWPEGLSVSDGGTLGLTENGIATETVRAYQV